MEGLINFGAGDDTYDEGEEAPGSIIAIFYSGSTKNGGSGEDTLIARRVPMEDIPIGFQTGIALFFEERIATGVDV